MGGIQWQSVERRCLLLIAPPDGADKVDGAALFNVAPVVGSVHIVSAQLCSTKMQQKSRLINGRDGMGQLGKKNGG